MQAVLQAYVDVFVNELEPDQAKAIEWIVRAIDNTYVQDKDTRQWYKTNGTLMSGWRLTTFMNTVLNKVYIELSTRDTSMVSLHNGDDVLSAVTTIRQLQRMMVGTSRHNIRFQISKCFLASIAEFLRVDHARGKGQQYLARAAATMVHGPTETIVPNDLVQLVTACKTRATEMIQRGAEHEVVERFKDQQLVAISNIWSVDLDDLKALDQTHLSRGGVSSEISNNSLRRQITRVVLHERKDEEAVSDLSRNMPGAYDFAQLTCTTVVDSSYFMKVYSAAKKAIFQNSITKRFGITVKEVNADAISNVIALRYGSLRNLVGNTKVELAKAYSIPLTAIKGLESQLMHAISQESDKLQALSILM